MWSSKKSGCFILHKLAVSIMSRGVHHSGAQGMLLSPRNGPQSSLCLCLSAQGEPAACFIWELIFFRKERELISFDIPRGKY